MSSATPAASATPQTIWRVRSFNLTLAAALFSGIAFEIYELGLPLLIYQLTKRPLEVNALRAISLVPNILFAFLIGSVVDAVDRKTVLAGALLSLSCLTAALYAMTMQGSVHLELVYAVAFFVGLCMYTYGNAQTVVIRYVVPQPLATSAISMLAMVATTLAIAAPLFTGLLLATGTLRVGPLFAAAFFMLAALVTVGLRLPVERKPLRFEAIRQRMASGWSEFVGNKPLRTLTLCASLSNMAVGVYEIDNVVLLRGFAHLDAAAVGVILAVAGGGAICGSAAAKTLRSRFAVQRLFSGVTLVAAVGYLALGAVPNGLVSTVVGFAEGFCSALIAVCVWSIRQETVPAEQMGAVAGLTGSFFKIGMPFAIIIAGAVVERSGIGNAFFIAGAISLVALLVIATSPSLRALPNPHASGG